MQAEAGVVRFAPGRPVRVVAEHPVAANQFRLREQRKVREHHADVVRDANVVERKYHGWV